MEGFTNSVAVGSSGRVIVNVSSSRAARIAKVSAHLAPTIAGTNTEGGVWPLTPPEDGKTVGAIRYWPQTRGVYNLLVTAVDANGCTGTTPTRRLVTVK